MRRQLNKLDSPSRYNRGNRYQHLFFREVVNRIFRPADTIEMDYGSPTQSSSLLSIHSGYKYPSSGKTTLKTNITLFLC